jgi:3-deoxy-D-manno-octulosonic acid (KDO) 8-phosphate synthase
MSQFGMQMPGGRQARAASMNVYTALLFLAAVALTAACVFMWVQGTKVAKPGGAMAPLLGIQEPGRIELPDAR